MHWLIVNIPGGNLTAGQELLDYVGSGPQPGYGLHRYVFLIYKQRGFQEFDEAIRYLSLTYTWTFTN